MKNTILLLGVLGVTACTKTMERANINVGAYPATQRTDAVDTYFGVKVEDPYRWLEQDTAALVEQWVTEQNKVTQSCLNQIPFREKIKNRLTEIWNYPKYSSPFKEGEYYYFFKNNGLQNQSVLYRQKGINTEPEVFLDPNVLSEDGTPLVPLKVEVIGMKLK
jgi:prolyl oligopeptidase